MDYLLDNKIKLEKAYYNSKSSKHALALNISYGLIYFITKQEDYLYKIEQVSNEIYKLNSADFNLYIFNALICLESGNLQKLSTIIDDLNKYKGFIKYNNKIIYSWYLYIVITYQLNKENNKNFFEIATNILINKNIKALEELSDLGLNTATFLYGLVKIQNKELLIGTSLIYKSYRNGFKSIYLFINLNKIYKNKLSLIQIKEMVIGYISWSLAKNIDISEFIDKNEKQLTIILKSNKDLLKKIYSVYDRNWLLKNICDIYIQNNIYTFEAYLIYREAEYRKLDIPHLSKFLIEASFVNSINEISRYSMYRYLEESGIDVDIKVYIFHVILNSGKMKDLLESYQEEIIEFALLCLEYEAKGIYYNSLYKYLIEESIIQNLPSNFINTIEDILNDSLFKFRLEFSDNKVNYVWVIEKEKTEQRMFKVVKNEAIIKSSSKDFSLVCFEDGGRRISKQKPKITAYIDNESIEFYIYFYRRGFFSAELMITLSRLIISSDCVQDEFLDVLKSTVNINEISTSFKNECLVFIANVLFKNNNINSAMDYYRSINQNCLNNKDIEQILDIFIKSKNYDEALRILELNEDLIAYSVLYSSIKELLKLDGNTKKLVNLQYKLLLNSWYDEVFLENVIKFYNGSQSDFQELRKALATISVFKCELDEIILNNCIYMRSMDVETQSIFVNLYKKQTDNKTVLSFAYYCVYELIVNKFKLEIETVELLEDLYFKNEDKILTYGLICYYIENNITTPKSFEIIKRSIQYMEEDSLIIPIIKNIKDKKLLSSYIEKKQPFWYKTMPDLNVYLYYKLKDEPSYRSKKMDYFMFGIYYCNITQFYNEEIIYYFLEEHEVRSLTTRESLIKNSNMLIIEDSKDEFFNINNALIYEQMFKYNKVENIINDFLREFHSIKGKLI